MTRPTSTPRRAARRALLLSLVVAGAGAPAARAGDAPAPVTLRLSCGAVGQELDLCRQAAESWATRTGHRVEVVATPNDASARLALYEQVLAAGSDRIDVFQVDVVWPGLLASHFVDLRPALKGAEAGMLPDFVAADTVDGRLVAVPWFVNAGLLFYRRDLLEKYEAPVPTTWDELAATARRVQDGERAAGHARLWGFVWQGRAYEGLTCNALEWIASSGGGRIVDADGLVTVDNPRAASALKRAVGWVGTITPPAVLNYGEEEARGVFQAGDAVFMRNWPYAWALAQADRSAIRGRVGVAMLPHGEGGKPVGTLGGESLAVSKYSAHPALAAELVAWMTGAAVQKERAIAASFNPTLVALYQDADVLRANPFMGELAPVFLHAVARPSVATGTHYNQVSDGFWNAVHDALAKQAGPEEALHDVAGQIDRVGRGSHWSGARR